MFYMTELYIKEHIFMYNQDQKLFKEANENSCKEPKQNP